MKRWHLYTFFSSFILALALLAGCTTLDEKQRAWIFQPSDRTWGGGVAAAQGMDDVWITFTSKTAPAPEKSVRLHGLWLEADQPLAIKTSSAAPLASPVKSDAPVLLYLHGARYNVTGSAPRIRRMQELGFSVLAIDSRGFGRSTSALPSEVFAYEDARAAWDWLAEKYPNRPRYIFGHSLGGSIAINLATEVKDESGTIVEGAFTSIADVISSSQWGWVPMSMLITQRFEAVNKVNQIGSPLLVVHGGDDHLILPDLGRKLFAAAVQPKQFILVEGGTHHNTNLIGLPQYKEALSQLFSLK